ncbi:MAG: toprim domain-containing protein [Pirellulales bacterium]|nr:toprim domain-containing protein [Pirellulales bacterium]
MVGSEGAGWLHRLRDDRDWQDRPQQRRVKAATPPAPAQEFARMAEGWHRVLGPLHREHIAQELGVNPKALEMMQVGWSSEHRATSWPMRDGNGRVCGIRLRQADGNKWSVRGSKSGLFVASSHDPFGGGALPGTLVISEGATDAAALLSLGVECYGRPSCNGGTEALVEYCSPHTWERVAIIADADAPGQRGARYLAARLVGYAPGGVKICTPPAKDVREWIRGGATAEDINALIEGAPLMRLTYSTKGGTR